MFPAITATITSHSPPPEPTATFYKLKFWLSHPLVFTAFHFLLFNFGDWIGRWLCKFKFFLFWSGPSLLLSSLLRLLFIPLILACASYIKDTQPRTPFIQSDLPFFLILSAFGISNGYLGRYALSSSTN